MIANSALIQIGSAIAAFISIVHQGVGLYFCLLYDLLPRHYFVSLC